MCAMAGRRKRSIGSDDTSDEEFEIGGSEDDDVTSEDEEMDNSDALSDRDDEEEDDSPDSEVDDDADYEEEEDEDDDFVFENSGKRRPVTKKNSRRTFGAAGKKSLSTKKRRGRPPKKLVVSEEEEEEEEEDYDYDEDDSDEDFSPDEEENEEIVKITVRKRSATRKGSGGKRGRRKTNNSRIMELVDEEEYEVGKRRKKKQSTTRRKKTKAKPKKDGAGSKRFKGRKRKRTVSKRTGGGAVRGRGRRRRVIVVDDGDDDEDDLDFVVEDERVRDGGKRRWRESDPSSDRESSDFQTAPSVPQLPYLPFVNANCKKRRTERVSEKEKGKGKAIESSGKQVCGICLSEERKGVAQGVLNSCAHYFCFVCIMEWSKVESRCPVCKQRFETITKTLVSTTILGLGPTVVRVPKRDQVYQPSEEELWGFFNPYENVVCMECLQGGDDNLMLLCDLCDSPAHTYCVGLGREVPEGDWYCNACRSAEAVQNNSHSWGSENALVSNNSEVPSYATSDRLVSLQEILQQPNPRGLDSSLSPHIPSAETNGIARASGPSALTVSARRALSQRFRLLLSSVDRVRNQVPPATNDAQFESLEGDATNSENGQRRRAALPDELNRDYNGRPQRAAIRDLNSPPSPCASWEDRYL